MSNYAPILLFVYNRFDHLRLTVESLQANTLAKESELYIYSDAAKDDSGKTAVGAVRDFIHTITGFAGVKIVEREKNIGLAANVIDGVSAILKQHGRVIVVEDDLVLAPYFLQFMNDALEIYKDEPRVGHIYACDFTQSNALPDTFLIKWIGSWGWATWDRAWKYFNPDGKALLEELERRKLTRVFDFNGNYGFTRMLRKQIQGKNSSWAIRWNASLFLNDILSLSVGKSLVQNKGFDGSGTHCGGGGLYDSSLWLQPLPVKKISPIEENLHARSVLEAYYKHTNSFQAKAFRRIKRTLRGDFGA